jgi:hypothetical protein
VRTSPSSNVLHVAAGAVSAGAIVLLLSLTSPLRLQGGDTVPGRLGMATLACRGNQDLSDVDWVARLVAKGTRVYLVRPALEGRGLVSSFGPGPAWIGSLVPLGVEPGALVTDEHLKHRARVAASSAVALAAGLVVVGASAHVAPLIAAFLGLAAAVSFAGVATLAQGLWQQTAALPLLAGALAAMLWCGRVPRLLPAAALCASCAAWIRPADLPVLVLIGAGAAHLSLRAERSLVTVATALVAACLGAAGVLAWDLWYLDTPWPVAQWSANARITEHVFSLSARDVFTGLTGLSLSWGRGVVWFAPLVPLFVGLAVAAWRRARSEAAVAAICLAAGIAGQWVLAGWFFKWWGGVGFGPRLLAETVWVAAGGTALLVSHAGARARLALLVACALGVAIGALGLARSDVGANELELDRIHRAEAYFAWSAAPWNWTPSKYELLDAPPGPFVYCAEHSLGAVN